MRPPRSQARVARVDRPAVLSSRTLGPACSKRVTETGFQHGARSLKRARRCWGLAATRTQDARRAASRRTATPSPLSPILEGIAPGRTAERCSKVDAVAHQSATDRLPGRPQGRAPRDHGPRHPRRALDPAGSWPPRRSIVPYRTSGPVARRAASCTPRGILPACCTKKRLAGAIFTLTRPFGRRADRI